MRAAHLLSHLKRICCLCTRFSYRMRDVWTYCDKFCAKNGSCCVTFNSSRVFDLELIKMSYCPIGAHGMLIIDVFLPRYFDKFTMNKTQKSTMNFHCSSMNPNFDLLPVSLKNNCVLMSVGRFVWIDIENGVALSKTIVNLDKGWLKKKTEEEGKKEGVNEFFC